MNTYKNEKELKTTALHIAKIWTCGSPNVALENYINLQVSPEEFYIIGTLVQLYINYLSGNITLQEGEQKAAELFKKGGINK